jgi:DtxR family transcriptional regulator, Mn-dependent transcriptional regulator
MAESKALTESLEDYLEAIFHVAADKGAARAKDISKKMKVNSSSVTGALRALFERGLVNYAPYDVITLTPKGTRVAKDVIRRHEILRDFFVTVLSVEEAEAEKGACRMEHAVPRDILERLVQYIDFLHSCPRAGSKWIQGFGHYCHHGGDEEDCEQCISLCLDELKRKKSQESPAGGTTVALLDMKPGQKAKIVQIRDRGSINKRIVDMGVEPGTMIEVERVAPLGDPVDVKVKGYHLSLRKDEATGITVELQ